MGVFERPAGSGVWWVLYYVGGQRRREKIGAKGAAQKLYQKRKAEALALEKLPELSRNRATFGELLDDVLQHVKREHKSEKDYEIKAALLRVPFGSAKAEALTHSDFEAWLIERGVGNATQNRYRAFLSLAYRLGMRAGKASSNPARLIQHMREPAGRIRFLSREEMDTLVQLLPEARKAEVLVAAYTGMRLMEQYTLEWQQIDWRRKIARLADTKNGEGRDVPLNSVVLESLLPLRRITGLVFPRPRGGKKTVSRKWFLNTLERAGIHGATWHTLRHTFCSWHAMAGTPLKTIQELAGHKSIAITARYAHLCPDYRAEAAERIVVPTIDSTTATYTATTPTGIQNRRGVSR